MLPMRSLCKCQFLCLVRILHLYIYLTSQIGLVISILSMQKLKFSEVIRTKDTQPVIELRWEPMTTESQPRVCSPPPHHDHSAPLCQPTAWHGLEVFGMKRHGSSSRGRPLLYSKKCKVNFLTRFGSPHIDSICYPIIFPRLHLGRKRGLAMLERMATVSM